MGTGEPSAKLAAAAAAARLPLVGHGIDCTRTSPVPYRQLRVKLTHAPLGLMMSPGKSLQAWGCRRACGVGRSARPGKNGCTDAANLEWSGQLMLHQPYLFAAATRWQCPNSV